MRKIPTLYVRDPEDRRFVTHEITPGCGWVLEGEGIPTRKVDGTCMMLDEEGRWWARREVKPGKPLPQNFEPINFDENTGKTVGWEPVEQSPFFKFWREANDPEEYRIWPGTYELVGPKINGNPEGFDRHVLVPHTIQHLALSREGSPEELIQLCRAEGWEGVVWHHPDGRMAKLKVRDFRKDTD